MAKNLLSCSPLYLTVIVVCSCFVDAHQLGLQKTDDEFKVISQSGVEKVLTLFINQQGKLLEMIENDKKRAHEFQSLILEMIENDRESVEACQSLILEMIKYDREGTKAFQSLILEMDKNNRESAEAFQKFVETTNASINDLKAEIESLEAIVKQLLHEKKILKIRESSSDWDSSGSGFKAEAQRNKAFEIMSSTGHWVGYSYYAASLICNFGLLDGLPYVSGMKAAICPFVKMPSFKFSG